MAKSLSSYWVKFFTGAGFPLDVATKHAVVFSNNRIKPDMLPDLDKPSLKEMGITLMGDMIAILRYAKKVSEEMTCEKFLVDTDESPSTRVTKFTRVPVKKVTSKDTTASINPTITKSSVISKTPLKVVKTGSSSLTTNSAQIKKAVNQAQLRLISNETSTKKRKIAAKPADIKDSESDEEWSAKIQKRLKVTSVDDMVGYKFVVVRPSESGIRKGVEQKRTVFDRLGDSSVTSTTSSTNTSESSTTFNVTGLGDVVKRNSSVFNRLGDKDARKEPVSVGILKNGSVIKANGQPQGILKSKLPNLRTTTVKLKSPSAVNKITTGTMRADHEANKTRISNSVRQLVKSTKAFKLKNVPSRQSEKKLVLSSKLASERGGSLPAKARLGMTGEQKQVTFNQITTVKHIKKPGVFSRLGL